MDRKKIEADIKNYKIREGYLHKRSKFLKDWRKRWVVLTTNFIYTFTSNKMDEVTDCVDLKDIKTYKSYLRKDEQMIPAGFKIRCNDDMFYFSANSVNEKWSWLVSLERLMDYKVSGSSYYNNYDWIKTKGFDSQLDFENGGHTPALSRQVAPLVPKTKVQETIKKEVKDDSERIQRQIENQMKELQRKEEELFLRNAELEKRMQSMKAAQISPSKSETEQPFPKRQTSEPPPQIVLPAKVESKEEPQVEPPSKVYQPAPPVKEEEVSTTKVSELRKLYQGK